MNKVDLSLYFVVHSGNLNRNALVDLVLKAVEGGVTIVQLREKEKPFDEFCEIGQALLQHLKPLGIPLIINDNVDVAKAINADGIHLGQSDKGVAYAREVLGPKVIVGLTANTFEEGLLAEELAIDYLGAGPIFPTQTKLDCGPHWDLAELELLCLLSPHPIVGIGGINASNITKVMRAKLAGIAVVSAILDAEDPKAAAERLLTLFIRGHNRA